MIIKNPEIRNKINEFSSELETILSDLIEQKVLKNLIATDLLAFIKNSHPELFDKYNELCNLVEMEDCKPLFFTLVASFMIKIGAPDSCIESVIRVLANLNKKDSFDECMIDKNVMMYKALNVVIEVYQSIGAKINVINFIKKDDLIAYMFFKQEENYKERAVSQNAALDERLAQYFENVKETYEKNQKQILKNILMLFEEFKTSGGAYSEHNEEILEQLDSILNIISQMNEKINNLTLNNGDTTNIAQVLDNYFSKIEERLSNVSAPATTSPSENTLNNDFGVLIDNLDTIKKEIIETLIEKLNTSVDEKLKRLDEATDSFVSFQKELDSMLGNTLDVFEKRSEQFKEVSGVIGRLEEKINIIENKQELLLQQVGKVLEHLKEQDEKAERILNDIKSGNI